MMTGAGADSSGALLARITTEGVQTLGSPAQRSYELLTATLRDRLGPEAAALLAEPIATANGAAVDWYAPLPGRAQPLASLTDAERDSLLADLQVRTDAIRALADKIAAQKTKDGYFLAEALRNALEVPDESAIWALRQGEALVPVIVNWGRIRDDRRAVRGVLSMVAPRARAPRAPTAAVNAVPAVPASATVPIPSTPATTSRQATRITPWWLVLGWILLAVLIAIILWLLVAPCGLRPGLLGPCQDGDSRTAALIEARQDLLAEIGVLEARLQDLSRDCLPEQAAGDSGEVDRRIAVAGGQSEAALAFALMWNGQDDLDLAVTCPAGETVDFRNSQSAACGAVLDVDANFPIGFTVDDPVENVIFDQKTPGTYQVTVRRFADRDPAGPTDFTLFVRDAQGQIATHRGQLTDDGAWTLQQEITP